MSDFFSTLLWPLRWVIELILVGWHSLLTTIGLPGNAGFTWVLAIALLLVIVRLAMLPLMVRSVKRSQQLALITPEINAIREKYRGKNDAESQAALSAETLTLYRESNVNPLGSILPLLIQVPVFFGLYYVLRTAQTDNAGVGLLTKNLATSFGNSTLFGAPLHDSLFNNHGNVAVIILSIVLILIVGVPQFFIQVYTFNHNMTSYAQQQPMRRFQLIPLYLVPVILILTSLAIPTGLLCYLALSSIWTLAQQLTFIRQLPMPTSPAAAAKAARDKKRGKTPTAPAS